MTSSRIEKDSIGEFKILETAAYGIHAAWAVENFPMSVVLPRQRCESERIRVITTLYRQDSTINC